MGLVIAVGAFLVYWLANRGFDAGRGDFFYLADAFLHGRTWIERRWGPTTSSTSTAASYVPFAPFPAIVLAPLVALVVRSPPTSWSPASTPCWRRRSCSWRGGRRADRRERLRDRFGLVLLLGSGTQVLWVTTRGGVWHTGHLVAMILTLLLIGEMFGSGGRCSWASWSARRS